MAHNGKMSGDTHSDGGIILYRTPSIIRILVVGVLSLDIILLEVILQVLVVIPPLVQALIVLLVAGLALGLTVGLSCFVTVRGGQGWIEVHRLRWRKINARDISYVQLLGPFPSFYSFWLRSRTGDRVRLGALAVRAPLVRKHLGAMVEQAALAGRVTIYPAACHLLGLDVPSDLGVLPSVPVPRLIVATIASGVIFAGGLRGFADSWAAAAAMGVAASALAGLFFWWIAAPLVSPS